MRASSTSHYHKENEDLSGGGRYDEHQFQFQCLVTDSGLHSQTLIPMLGRMMLQKREPRLRRSSDQKPPNLPQCALPYQRAPLKPKNSIPPPSVPVREDTPWPGTGKMLGNLFEDRNWLLPKNYLATENKNVDGDQIALSAKIRTRKIGMANIKISYSRRHHPSQKCEGPKQDTPKLQKPDQEAPIDKYPSETKICQQWETEMERLNTKYNLDCFSDSELDSESNESNIAMSMGMRHLFKKCQNTEFIKIKFCNDIILNAIYQLFL